LATFGYKFSELEDVQSNLALATKIAEQMIYGQEKTIEQFIIKTAVEGANSSNVLGSLSTELTASTIAKAVEDIVVGLQEQNVDPSTSGLFVSPKIASLIRQSSYFTGFRE